MGGEGWKGGRRRWMMVGERASPPAPTPSAFRPNHPQRRAVKGPRPPFKKKRPTVTFSCAASSCTPVRASRPSFSPSTTRRCVSSNAFCRACGHGKGRGGGERGCWGRVVALHWRVRQPSRLGVERERGGEPHLGEPGSEMGGVGDPSGRWRCFCAPEPRE
jgi:hypothetical protein